MKPIESLLFYLRFSSSDGLEICRIEFLNAFNPCWVTGSVCFRQDLCKECEELTCDTCFGVFVEEADAHVESISDGCFGEVTSFDRLTDLGLGKLEGFIGGGFVNGLGGEKNVHFLGNWISPALRGKGCFGCELFATTCD